MSKETTAKPLTLEQYAAERKLPLDYLVKVWGLKELERDGIRCIEQPYVRMDGTVCAPRYRYANAKKSPANCGDRIILYGQKQLLLNSWRHPANTEPIILVEGESDTQTLRYAAFNVLGVPGTSMLDTCIANDPDILTFLDFRPIFFIQEPPSKRERDKQLDSPTKLLAKIRKSVPGRVIAVRLWEFAPRDEDGKPLYKDVSGLWMHYDGNVGKFAQALITATRAANKAEAGETWELQSVLASDVEMDLTRWLWYERIPVGEVTVFAGMPGQGKSTVAYDVVARLTKGRDFPAGTVKQVDACEVLVLASEENHHTTTKPRLIASGAETRKVHLVQGVGAGEQTREVVLDTDLAKVEQFLELHPEIKLVVIDPVTSYIGEVDPNKPKDVRPFLNRLRKFAEEMGVGVLLVMHLSKNPDVSAIHRVGGAATWIEVPRSVWFFAEKELDEESENKVKRYVMANGKLNIIADNRKKSLEYTFGSVDVAIKGFQQSMGVINWGEESSVTLEQLYGHRKDKPGPEPKQRTAATSWLREFLATGEQHATKVYAEGSKHGYSSKVLRAAKEGIVEVEQLQTGWVWRLMPE